VFSDGDVYTYNDEMCVSTKIPEIEGTCAVPANELLNILSKMKGDTVDIDISEGKMVIKTPRTEAMLIAQNDVFLPIPSSEQKSTDSEVGNQFFEALYDCSMTVSKDATKPYMFCVHINNDYMQSCDGYQLTQYKHGLSLKIKESGILIPSPAIRELAKHGIKKATLKIRETWADFEVESGGEPYVFSCRLFQSDYINTERIVKGTDNVITNFQFPPTFIDSLEVALCLREINMYNERAAIHFDKNMVTVVKKTEKGIITEKNRVRYDGESFSVNVNPALLLNLLKKSDSISICHSFIKSESDGMLYVIPIHKGE